MRWFLLAALLPTALAAQTPPPALHVEGIGEPVTVAVSMHRGYPVYPAWSLRAVGARVDPSPRGIRVIFGADTLYFDSGSPFFHAHGGSWQLVDAPYREGGIFYLPRQLFVEWLPHAYPDQLRFAAGHLRLAGAASEGANGDVAADSAAAPAPAPTAAGSGGAKAAPAGKAGGAGKAGEAGPAKKPEAAPASPKGQPVATPLVVIDPGHGGVDPGRAGPSGLKEKDIVLQVSKRLAKELAGRGYEVRMTRTTDTLIPLGQRPHMANEWRGNRPGLFISIHANGVSDRRVTGYETFFLSDARTEDERRVAEMENSAVAYESPDRVVGSGDDVDLILNHLRNDFYIRASNTLAGLVQDEFRGFHSGHNRGVKQAGFRVLVGAFMPAVLVELAFISNPKEERLLGSGRFQVEVADGIADAVDRFFESQGELWGATR